MGAPEEIIKKLVESSAEFKSLDDEDDDSDELLTAHPLAQFVELDDEVQAPDWIIPGFIADGIVAIAGAPGVGKTTALLPLTMVAAGLCAGHDDLRPKHWRRIVYITEDLAQAQRVLLGLVRHGGLGVDMATVKERIEFVGAKRLDPAFVVKVGKLYRRKFTRWVQGVELPPLVVIDTKSAVFDVADENDNAMASRLIALLKQEFADLPVWLVGHLAKAQINLTAARELSMRGGGAIEGDATQSLYLVAEGDGTRYLVRGKTRFEARWPELRINSYTAMAQARTKFGDYEEVVLRWGMAVPPEVSRQEATQQAREQARKDATAEVRQAVLDAVEVAQRSGCPINRAGVKAKVPHKAQDVVACIDALVTERWLIEVDVPAKERLNNSRKAFLVALSAAEHDDVVLKGKPIPEEKWTIPKSWKRPDSVVPKPKAESSVSETPAAPADANSGHSHSGHSLKEKGAGTSGMGPEAPHSLAHSQEVENDPERAGTTGNGRADIEQVEVTGMNNSEKEQA